MLSIMYQRALIACLVLFLSACSLLPKDPCRLLPPGSCQQPEPTATPAPQPTASPTAVPTLGTPTPLPSFTPLPTATPEPPSCVPSPGPEPVSLKQTPRCKPGFEQLPFLEDPTLCAVIAGSDNGRTSWRLGYGIARQGMEIYSMRGAIVQRNPDRGCTDALGRFFPGCGDLYSHPEGPSAPYTWGGYTMPTFCPAQTPTPKLPPPTPMPGSMPPPLMTRFKVGGFGQDCKNGSICCHNPEEGNQFQQHHICEVGSTQLFDYADPDKRGLRHGGPCDSDHELTWFNICGQRDWDILGGPAVEVFGAYWEKSDSNPHHTLVEFIPGKPFIICVYAPLNPKTADGLEVLVADNNRTCSEHLYY